MSDQFWTLGVSATFNVANCLRYLRAVGVEISDEQAQSWKDTESVFRWLRRERRSAKDWRVMACRNGHQWTAAFFRPARSKAAKALAEAAAHCPECGEGWAWQGGIASLARDGTMKDYRPQADRWQPLPSDTPTLVDR